MVWKSLWTLCHGLFRLALLPAICLAGDFVTFQLLQNQPQIYRAMADNATHGLVALASWILIDQWALTSALFCGVMGMGIDVDHFIQAGSFSLEEATSLQSRPFLHNSTWPLSIYIVAMTLNKTVIHCDKLSYWLHLVFVAFCSHHLRDASRRGLWLPPLIESLYVSYAGYIIMTVLLVVLVKFFLELDHVAKLPVTINDAK